MKKAIPTNIQKLFWDVDRQKLNVASNRKSIIERVLNYGVLSDWRWLMRTYGAETVEEVVSARGSFLRTNVREQSRRLLSLLIK